MILHIEKPKEPLKKKKKMEKKIQQGCRIQDLYAKNQHMETEEMQQWTWP